MFIVGLDRSWFETPFLFHRKLIDREEEIEQLRRHGIREVVIDTARGADVGAALAPKDIPESQRCEPVVEAASSSAAPMADAAPLSAAEEAFQAMGREIDTAKAVHQEALSLAQSIFDGAGGGAAIDHDLAGMVVTRLRESITRSPGANLLLMQMRRFQRGQFNHAVNVCVLSLVVATTTGLTDDLDALGTGALLHDVGETRLPRSLLRKSGPWSETELALVRRHPGLGAEILESTEKFAPLIRRIVLEHHERIDGSGYPSGLSGAALDGAVQLVGLTDDYDDMLSGRHHAALQPTEVLRQLYLQANGGAVDRALVQKLIRSLGVYPIGTVVELNTGERGVVVANNRTAALKPIVRVIMSRSGLVQYGGPLVSLADPDGNGVERQIVAVINPVKEGIDPMVFMRLAPGVLR
jgi:HD-GYP domain-containing protein (c-di-GMP phosphodiesterase class II)